MPESDVSLLNFNIGLYIFLRTQVVQLKHCSTFADIDLQLRFHYENAVNRGVRNMIIDLSAEDQALIQRRQLTRRGRLLVNFRPNLKFSN